MVHHFFYLVVEQEDLDGEDDARRVNMQASLLCL